MGIQIYVEIAALRAAGVEVELYEPEEYYAEDEGGVLHVDSVWQDACTTAPDGSILVWNVSSVDPDVLWLDANHWGSNRTKILDLLIPLGIPYIEG